MLSHGQHQVAYHRDRNASRSEAQRDGQVPVSLQVVVTTRYGTDYINWSVKVRR